MTDETVISYADLIEAHHLALLIAELESDPYSSLWEELIDKYGEAELIRLGADL